MYNVFICTEGINYFDIAYSAYSVHVHANEYMKDHVFELRRKV